MTFPYPPMSPPWRGLYSEVEVLASCSDRDTTYFGIRLRDRLVSFCHVLAHATAVNLDPYYGGTDVASRAHAGGEMPHATWQTQTTNHPNCLRTYQYLPLMALIHQH